MEPDLGELSEQVAQLRGDHTRESLEISDLDPDPFVQFGHWLQAALDAHPDWPNAMALATADAAGRPSVRMVLLKGIDHAGFVFFTNHESRKGRDLSANPFAALTFYWPGLERQVSVRGSVARISDAESDEYFESRPLDSRIGAWASRQSRPLGSRAELEAAVAELRERFGDDIPRPPHWGGYRLSPDAFEFWKSKPNRLHDRFTYLPRDGGGWEITRLYP